jgi:hypothetical protein
MRTGQHQAEAGVAVVRSLDEALGSVIDLVA